MYGYGDDDNFGVEVGFKILANGSTVMEKPLPDTTRFGLDLSPVESAIDKAISTVAKDEQYQIQRRVCSIRTQRGATRKNIDIDDFGSESAVTIDTALAKVRHHSV